MNITSIKPDAKTFILTQIYIYIYSFPLLLESFSMCLQQKQKLSSHKMFLWLRGNNDGVLAFKSAELADLLGCATDTWKHLA